MLLNTEIYFWMDDAKLAMTQIIPSDTDNSIRLGSNLVTYLLSDI